MKFGSATASRIGRVHDPALKNETFRWCLDRVEDPKTNYMEFIYLKDVEDPDQGGRFLQIYLQEIKYNGQLSGSLPHNHKVLFNLESSNRPDPIYNYRGGFKMLTRKRLSSIEVRTNNALVKKYQLEYKEPFSDPNAYNVRSLLSQITLYGNDGSSSLPPVKFSYQELDNRPAPNNQNRGFADEAIWPNPSASGPRGGNYIRNNYVIDVYNYGTFTDVIDMDGDGLRDRVVYDREPPYTPPDSFWTVYFNYNGSGGAQSAMGQHQPSTEVMFGSLRYTVACLVPLSPAPSRAPLN
jgi:hypothetical protein